MRQDLLLRRGLARVSILPTHSGVAEPWARIELSSQLYLYGAYGPQNPGHKTDVYARLQLLLTPSWTGPWDERITVERWEEDASTNEDRCGGGLHAFDFWNSMPACARKVCKSAKPISSCRQEQTGSTARPCWALRQRLY